METFIKLYDWTRKTGFDQDTRTVLSLIHQFSENDNIGYWAGYKTMSDRTGYPKSKCKAIVEKLKEQGFVTESRATVFRKTRIILRSNKNVTLKFL